MFAVSDFRSMCKQFLMDVSRLALAPQVAVRGRARRRGARVRYRLDYVPGAKGILYFSSVLPILFTLPLPSLNWERRFRG